MVLIIISVTRRSNITVYCVDSFAVFIIFKLQIMKVGGLINKAIYDGQLFEILVMIYMNVYVIIVRLQLSTSDEW